ncbi:MAG TPA: hypothetical protein VMG12_09545, partial [Polyangiaceae bacterium]|nr:hypothetical protein [Polyangiaceae bacterium]
GCTEQHWREVHAILSEAIAGAGLTPHRIGDDEPALLQKRTLQDLYRSPIVVCDVSGKNPNVMFALGMRLAFDQPTIIVQDDATHYCFDGVPLEHLGYPRDLRYSAILQFERELGSAVSKLFRATRSEASAPSFLRHFGNFAVAQRGEREVSRDDALFEELRELEAMVRLMRQNPRGLEAQNAGRTGHIVAKAMAFVARYVAQHGISGAELEQRKGEVTRALERELFPRAQFDSVEEWKEFCDALFAALPARAFAPGAARRHLGRTLRGT